MATVVGWHPPVWFDVGLQLRVGDVCGKHAMMRGQKSRKCSSQPAQDALELMHAHGLQGRLFVASDSHEAVETIVAMGPRYGFNVSSLRFDRGNIEGTAVDAQNHSIGTEMAKRSRTRDLAVLLESMMDVMLLSRSSVLVGSMMSNFPRMALQMRPQAPIAGEERYLVRRPHLVHEDVVPNELLGPLWDCVGGSENTPLKGKSL